MKFRTLGSLLTIASGTLACGATVVDLDNNAATGSDPSVIAVVSEQVERLTVDERRLYWVGRHERWNADGYMWALRSCNKDACASTLTTYAAEETDSGRQYGVSGDQIYWFTAYGGVSSCPVTGCHGSPLTVTSDPDVAEAFFDGDYYFFSDVLGDNSIYRVSLLQGGSRQLLTSSSDTVRAKAIRGAYLYWLVDGPNSDGRTTLMRIRKDGSAAAETLATDLDISFNREFSLVTDASSIYWTSNLLSGSIARCALTGCTDAPDVVLSPLRAPQALLLDDSQLYYEHEIAPYQYAISMCSLPDCAASEPLQEQLDSPSALATDSHFLYVATTEQDLDPNRPAEDIVARIHRLPRPNRDER